MPRGIAFDRYDVPEFRGATVRNPTLPADTSAADILGGIGKAVQTAALGAHDAQVRAKNLAESIKVDERYLQAAGEMDEQLVNISQDPAAREVADTVYGEWEKTQVERWGYGLTPAGNAALQKRLTEKRLGAQHKSRMIRVTDLGQRAEKNLFLNERVFTEEYSRLTDDGPWQESKAPESYVNLKNAWGRAVAAGAKTPAEMEKGLAKTREEAAATRVHGMMISGTDSDLNRLKTLFEMERQKPNSTWLSGIDAPTRAALEKQAKDADYTLYTRRRTENEHRRLERERKLDVDQKEWVTRSEQMLDDDSLTLEWIRDGENLGLATGKERYFRKALEDKGIQGHDDPSTVRRIGPTVWSVKSDPEKVLAEVEAAFVSDKIKYSTMKEYKAHLEGRLKDRDTRGRSEQETILNKERGEVEEYIKVLTTTKSPWEAFDPKANATRLGLLQDLGAVPRTESAQVWWRKNRAHFVSQMSDQASAVIKTQETMLHVKPVLGAGEKVATIDSIVRNKAAYERQFGPDARARMAADAARLEGIQMLREHIEILNKKSGGTPGPDAGGSSTPAAKPAAPLKPGSRS